MRERYFHRATAETPTRFWINDPSGQEMELSIAAGAMNCTTNPAYCSKLFEGEPDYIRGVIDRVIEETDDIDVAANRVYRAAAARVMTRFLPLHEESSGACGYVTIQDDPRRDDDAEAVIEAALRDRELGKNFMAKIPVTESGRKAIEALVEEDLSVEEFAGYGPVQ